MRHNARNSPRALALFWGLVLGCGRTPADTGSPTGVCPQVDLYEPKCTRPDIQMPLPTAAVGSCDSHEDCATGTFCNFQQCRVADEQYVLLCIDRATYIGGAPLQDGTPPNFAGRVSNRNPGELDKLLFVEAPHEEERCDPYWSHCELFFLGGTDSTYLALEDGTDPATAVEIVVQSFGEDPADTLGRMAERGCQEFTASYPMFDPEGTVTMWISVWSKEPPSI